MKSSINANLVVVYLYNTRKQKSFDCVYNVVNLVGLIFHRPPPGPTRRKLGA